MTAIEASQAAGRAAQQLCRSDRGIRTLKALDTFMQNHCHGLDSENQQAVMDIMGVWFHGYMGRAQDAIIDALDQQHA